MTAVQLLLAAIAAALGIGLARIVWRWRREQRLDAYSQLELWRQLLEAGDEIERSDAPGRDDETANL